MQARGVFQKYTKPLTAVGGSRNLRDDEEGTSTGQRLCIIEVAAALSAAVSFVSSRSPFQTMYSK